MMSVHQKNPYVNVQQLRKSNDQHSAILRLMRGIALFFFLPLLLALSAVEAASSTPIDVYVSKQEDTFDVKIPSNPTTGYTVSVSMYDQSLLQKIKQEFFPTGGDVPGASGVEVFTFKRLPKATYPATTFMLFHNQRSWEKAKASDMPIFVVVHFY